MNELFPNHALRRGGNLQFLRGMPAARDDLLASDPPLRKSREVESTPDSLTLGASFEERRQWRRGIDKGMGDRVKNDRSGA